MAPLHVFHTNDFHSRLSDPAQARLRALVESVGEAPMLLLDAGDAVKAGNVGVNPFGEPILDTMSALGYDAMTMGNREFHIWRAALTTKINRAAFPVLCANVRSRTPGRALPVQPSVTLRRCDLRIAVFGVTVPMVTERMAARAVSDFVFDDPLATASTLVPRLRADADLVIALTHIGLRDDERLAAAVPGIDLIIGGHSHVVLEQPKIVAGTPIVQAGMHGRYAGHVQITPASAGAPSAVSASLIPLLEVR